MGTKILQTDLARDALYTKVNTIADEKQDVLTFDSTPTSGSNNPVTSGGIKTYVDSGLNEKQDVLTFDSTPTSGSNNPATSGGIKTYVDSGLSSKAEDSEVVHKSGNETINGTKTFSASPIVPTPSVSSNTTVSATTAYVNNKLVKVSTLPASPNSDVYYYIPE